MEKIVLILRSVVLGITLCSSVDRTSVRNDVQGTYRHENLRCRYKPSVFCVHACVFMSLSGKSELGVCLNGTVATLLAVQTETITILMLFNYYSSTNSFISTYFVVAALFWLYSCLSKA
jgi:hypothetical protein